MPVGFFKSQQLAERIFSEVAEYNHIYAFQFISGKIDIHQLKHNPCFTRNDFTFALRSFQDGKRCLTQSELYPVAIDNFYIKSDIAIEFLRPLQIADINPAGIYSFNLHSYRVLFPHSVQTLSCNETMPPHSMQVYRAECIFRKLHIPSSLTISLFSTRLSS